MSGWTPTVTHSDAAAAAAFPDAAAAPFAQAPHERAAAERTEPDLLPRLVADPDARAIVVREDHTLLDEAGAIRWLRPAQAPPTQHWAFLGRDPDGTARLAAVLDPAAPLPAGRHGALREVGGALSASQASLFATAVSLGRWLTGAAFCPACGARTHVREAGWSRRCPACGREHFPRTDPAVIMTVSDDGAEPRLLLGSNRLWGANRYSCFAGFVEAGESAEAAVVRELREEAAVRVVDMQFRGSQPWPYPRSLMLGFHARIAADAHARADGAEIAEVRWFTPAQVRDALGREGWAGAAAPDEPVLPGRASIARHLIERWLADQR